MKNYEQRLLEKYENLKKFLEINKRNPNICIEELEQTLDEIELIEADLEEVCE